MASTTENDALGFAMEAYLKGNKKASVKVISSIAEDDKIPVKYLFRSVMEMPELEQIALKKCSGKILEVGAGAGSHALWLQENGFEVTAIDISEKATEIMRQRGVNFVSKADINHFRPAQKFDTILLLMNGIGIAGTLEKLPGFLNNLKGLLNPGGQILFDSSDILYMFEDEEGGLAIDLNSAYYGEVEYRMAFEKIISDPFPWLFIDYPLLSDHARNTGFKAECLFQDEHFQYLAKLTIA